MSQKTKDYLLALFVGSIFGYINFFYVVLPAEWEPVRAMWSLCFGSLTTILGLSYYGHLGVKVGRALFWIGAPLTLLFTVLIPLNISWAKLATVLSIMTAFAGVANILFIRGGSGVHNSS